MEPILSSWRNSKKYTHLVLTLSPLELTIMIATFIKCWHWLVSWSYLNLHEIGLAASTFWTNSFKSRRTTHSSSQSHRNKQANNKWQHSSALPSVRSTFFHASSPPRTSSTSFFESWSLFVICCPSTKANSFFQADHIHKCTSILLRLAPFFQ